VTETGQDQQREVYYLGTVQGVGFRYTTRRIASRFLVTGYVRNLPDGRVLVVAEGAADELDRFFEAIRAYLGDHIRDASETVCPASGRFERFDIRF
jgi:acylphosphatase